MPPLTNAQLLARAKRFQKSLKRETAKRKDLERALKESVEQQTATSEIRKVISSSPTDVQPVFDAIARNAVRLCGAVYSRVFRSDGQMISLAAHANLPGGTGEFPMPLNQETPLGRAIITGRVWRSADVEAEIDLPPKVRATFRSHGVRSALVVPIHREDVVVGAIGVAHRAVGAFADVMSSFCRPSDLRWLRSGGELAWS